MRLQFYSTAYNSNSLQCLSFHWTALHYSALHCTERNCIALHCIALHWTAMHCSARHGKRQFFTPARFEQKLCYPRKCRTCDKSEFVTKQRKMCLTTSISKIRLQHIYRRNNYVIIKKRPKRHKPWPIQKFKEFKTVSQSESFRKFEKFSETFKKFQKDSEIFRKFHKVS